MVGGSLEGYRNGERLLNEASTFGRVELVLEVDLVFLLANV